jgi:hypothetical protein
MKKSMKWMMAIAAILSAIITTSVNEIKAQPGAAVSYRIRTMVMCGRRTLRSVFALIFRTDIG